MTGDDLRQWYACWYGPNNATVVVVGDVQPQAVLALAKEHFGPLKARAIVPPKSRPEVPQKGHQADKLHQRQSAHSVSGHGLQGASAAAGRAR